MTDASQTTNTNIEPGTAPAPRPARSVLLGSLAQLGVQLGAVLVAGLLFAGAAAGLLDNPAIADAGASFIRLDVGSFLGLAIVLGGVAIGGELTAGIGSTASPFASAAGSASLWLFPLTLTLAIAAVTAWAAYRVGRRAPVAKLWQRALRSFGVSLAAAIVLLVLIAIASPRFGTTGDSHVYLTSAGVRLAPVGTAILGTSAWIGAELAARSANGDSFRSAVARVSPSLPRFVREAVLAIGLGLLVFAPFAVIGTALQLGDALGISSIPIALLFIPNTTAWLAVLGQFGGITAGASVNGVPAAQSTITVFSAGNGWLWFGVLLALVATALIAVRIGVRRARLQSIDWKLAWQLPVALLVTWIAYALTCFGVSFGGTGGYLVFTGSAAGAIGMSWWTPLVLAVWAAAIELGAATLPSALYRAAPAALAVVGGRAATNAWATGAPAPAVRATPGTPAVPATAAAPETAPAPEAPATTAGPASGTTPAALTPPAPLSEAAKRRWVLGACITGAVVLIGVAAGVSLSVINSMLRSPVALVNEYAGYIAAGDATSANRLVDPNLPPEERVFLTDEVLGSASEHISQVEVRDNADEGTADSRFRQLEVGYKLNGVDQFGTVQVERLDNEWLVLERWRITTPLIAQASVVANGPGGAAAIGDVEVPFSDAEDGTSTAQISAYPAVYSVDPTESTYTTSEPESLLVTTGNEEFGYAELTFAPTDALREAVQAQVNAKLDECARSTDDAPEDCPFGIYAGVNTPVTWSIVTYPVVELDETGTGYRAEGGVANAKYASTFLSTTTERTSDDSFDAGGTVTIDGDSVEVTMASGGWWF